MTRSLMIFGDSNTHGTPPITTLGASARFDHRHRWTSLLAAQLPDWEVVVEGQPGRTTLHDDPIEGSHRNGIRVLPALLESHRPLHLVVVMLGTNDLKHRFSVTAWDIAQSLERLVRLIRISGAGPMGAAPGVLLVAPPPILEQGVLAEAYRGGAEKSQRLGAEIGEMAARNGLPFVDLAPLIAVSPLDGIHYDAAAAPVIADAIATAIQTHFA